MTVLPVGTELFHADRRTDMTKIIVVVANFSKSNYDSTAY